MLEGAGSQGVITVDYTSDKLTQHLEQAVEIGLVVILQVKGGLGQSLLNLYGSSAFDLPFSALSTLSTLPTLGCIED